MLAQIEEASIHEEIDEMKKLQADALNQVNTDMLNNIHGRFGNR
jgi:hypothetical protein